MSVPKLGIPEHTTRFIALFILIARDFGFLGADVARESLTHLIANCNKNQNILHKRLLRYFLRRMIKSSRDRQLKTKLKVGMVMKLGKLQKSKQKCLDLTWKVHDCVQSFVLS